VKSAHRPILYYSLWGGALLASAGVVASLLYWNGSGQPITFASILEAYRNDQSYFAMPPGTTWRGALISLLISTWLFLTLWWSLSKLLTLNVSLLAVARLTINDTVRSKLGLVPVLALLVVLSLLPLTLGADQPLRYRVQTYMSYSLTSASLVLSLMTVLLACRTVTGELNEGVVSNLFSKPISRLNYLVGKFLGLALLNTILCVVAGVSIYLNTLSTGNGTVLNERDDFDTASTVLTARTMVQPAPPNPLEQIARNKYEQLKKENRLGQRPETEVLAELTEEARGTWRSVPPREGRTYVFDNIKARTGILHVRLKIEASPEPDNKRLDLGWTANGSPLEVLSVATGTTQQIPVNAEMVDKEGKLSLTFLNPNVGEGEAGTKFPTTVKFPDEKSLSLLYNSGTFDGNYWRAFAVLWARLLFLAMLGCVVGSVFSFSVAGLFTGTLWTIVTWSAAISDAYWTDTSNAGFVTKAYVSAVEPVLRGAVDLFSGYGRLDAVALIIDGRLVPTADLIRHVLLVGVGWTVVCFAVGWFLFSRRELARVQV
jgi:ABC-type transport system involved in multi-copper enzyme maturation permease subunit